VIIPLVAKSPRKFLLGPKGDEYASSPVESGASSSKKFEEARRKGQDGHPVPRKFSGAA